VSGVPPIRARKLRYYTDRNFLERRLPAPKRDEEHPITTPPAHSDDWSDQTRSTDSRLDKPWSEFLTSNTTEDDIRVRQREPSRRKKDRTERPVSDLPLFAASLEEPAAEEETSAADEFDTTIQFPGLRL